MSKADTAYSWVKSGYNKAKQYALNLTDIEIKVEEATNNDPWGPHGTAMTEIAKASYDIDNYKQIMGVIARRLQDTEEDWRHVYKSLLLLEFMSKHGPQKVVEELVSNIGVVEKLQSFQYKDAKSKDWGLNVRNRAKELANFVLDSDRVRSERAKAKANESKYTGTSNNDMRDSGSKDSGFGSKDSGFGSKSSFGNSGSALSKLPSGKSSSKSTSRYDDFDLPERSNATTRAESGGGFADDAVQATRARIEALRKDGPVPDSPSNRDSIPAKPQARSKPPALPEAKGPKKLSDVKVNANIAASLGNLKLSSPASSPAAGASSGGGAAARGAASGATAMPASTPAAPSHMDLLGSLEGPAAASSQKAAAPASPGADVWSTFSTSRDAPAAAPDAFGSSDPFGSAFATPAAAPAVSHDPFGTATASASASSDPFGSSNTDPFGALAPRAAGQTSSSNSIRTAQSGASADPFGMSSLSAAPAKPSTPTARALPEDMFAAPAVPAATGFSMGGYGAPQQMQQPGFGHFGNGFGQSGGGGAPQRPPFPGMQAGSGGYGLPQQQQNAFGAQQGGFSLQGSFGGQQSSVGGQQSGFGSSDPFGSSAGSFSSEPFGASSNIFAQGATTSPATLGKTGPGNSGGKDPFADLSAFH